MDTIKECFDTILGGNKSESRQAARYVRKLVYSAKDKGKYRDIKQQIIRAPREYAKIYEDWRRENFVMAVSVIYFLHDKENQPNFLFPWLYNLIQDPNGNIRHSAVRMLEHELGPLTVHIRFPGEKSSYYRGLSPKQADHILLEMYGNLVSLVNYLWKPGYKKYKYISSLPSGSYKSVQMVLGRFEEDCGKEYMARLAQLMGNA